MVAAACTLVPVGGFVEDRPIALFGHQGRWVTDAAGRVVMLRGVNFVEKWAPFTPEADGFSDDDVPMRSTSPATTTCCGVRVRAQSAWESYPTFPMNTTPAVALGHLGDREQLASEVRAAPLGYRP